MSYKSNIWKMYMFYFFRNFHFIGGVLVPFYTLWAGFSFFQMMLLNSVFVFSVFVMEIPTGAVADHFGRKPSIILSVICTVIGVLFYSFTPNIWLYLIGEFMWGTGFALMSGADEALLYDSLKKINLEKSSKKILGRYGSIEISAIAIAAPLGSVIAHYFGLRYAMFLMVIPFTLSLIFALMLHEPKTKKKVESKRYLITLVSGIRYFKKHKELKILAFDTISFNALVFMLIWIYQPLLLEFNFPIIYLGFMHASISGILVIFMNNLNFLEKVFKSRTRYLTGSALISGVAFILLGFSNSIVFTIILILLISAFGMSRGVLFKNYMHKYVKSHNRATVMSTISMFQKLASAIVYPLVGFVMGLSLSGTSIGLGVLIIGFVLFSNVEERHLID